MKKLFITLSLIAIPAMVLGQPVESSKEARQERREMRQQQYEKQLIDAINNKTFTFIAQTLQPATGPTQFIDPTNNYISVYPKYMDIYLPSPGNSWFVNPAFNLDLFVSNYTTKLSVSDGYLHLTINFENAMGEQPSNFTRNFTYTLRFTINLYSGATTLNVIPLYSSPVTYWGNIMLN